MMFNTRVAPSPTGFMHLGTARIAYLNWLAAKATNGAFHLRIDDTDEERNDDDCVANILEVMKWLGLDYDYVFSQSQNKDNYVAYANALEKAGYARRLENNALALIWRTEYEGLSWYDRVAKKSVKITSGNIRQADGTDGRIILLRGDATPTYHLASVCDDYDNDVTMVIRGIDHFNNTYKHTAIWDALCKASGGSKPQPDYAHVGLVCKDKKKLSKRDGADMLSEYMKKYHPEAVLNYILRLGWSPIQGVENPDGPIDRKKALELFVCRGNLRSSPANMDDAKLYHLDKHYKLHFPLTI